MGSVSAYQVGGVHRHTPEIEQAFAEAAGVAPTVSFTPLLAPMPRGILATCTARLARGPPPRPGASPAATRYPGPGAPPPGAGHRVRLGAVHPGPARRTAGRAPRPRLGSNAVHLQAAADAHAGRAVVVAALDNLVKGAAGQAIQIANLMLGLPEAAGLTANGVAP